MLQKYDEGTLSLENMKIMKTNKLEYKDALKAIDEMKKELLPK